MLALLLLIIALVAKISPAVTGLLELAARWSCRGPPQLARRTNCSPAQRREKAGGLARLASHLIRGALRCSPLTLPGAA